MPHIWLTLALPLANRTLKKTIKDRRCILIECNDRETFKITASSATQKLDLFQKKRKITTGYMIVFKYGYNDMHESSSS